MCEAPCGSKGRAGAAARGTARGSRGLRASASSEFHRSTAYCLCGLVSISPRSHSSSFISAPKTAPLWLAAGSAVRVTGGVPDRAGGQERRVLGVPMSSCLD